MDKISEYFQDCELVEITNKEEALRQLNSKTSCCWGAGDLVGDTGYITLCRPSKSHIHDKSVQFYCRVELIKE